MQIAQVLRYQVQSTVKSRLFSRKSAINNSQKAKLGMNKLKGRASYNYYSVNGSDSLLLLFAESGKRVCTEIKNKKKVEFMQKQLSAESVEITQRSSMNMPITVRTELNIKYQFSFSL